MNVGVLTYLRRKLQITNLHGRAPPREKVYMFKAPSIPRICVGLHGYDATRIVYWAPNLEPRG